MVNGVFKRRLKRLIKLNVTSYTEQSEKMFLEVVWKKADAWKIRS